MEPRAVGSDQGDGGAARLLLARHAKLCPHGEILKEKTSHVFEKEYSIEHARMSKRGAALPTNVEGALSLH